MLFVAAWVWFCLSTEFVDPNPVLGLSDSGMFIPYRAEDPHPARVPPL